MKEITNRYLQAIGACKDAREQFRKELNGGRSLSVSRVFTRLKQIDRMDWANWLIVRLMTHKQQIRYAIYAAEQVISLYEEKYPEDKRPRQAIEAARLCLDNPSGENKAAAWSAATSAESAAESDYQKFKHIKASFILNAAIILAKDLTISNQFRLF